MENLNQTSDELNFVNDLKETYGSRTKSNRDSAHHYIPLLSLILSGLSSFTIFQIYNFYGIENINFPFLFISFLFFYEIFLIYHFYRLRHKKFMRRHKIDKNSIIDLRENVIRYFLDKYGNSDLNAIHKCKENINLEFNSFGVLAKHFFNISHIHEFLGTINQIEEQLIEDLKFYSTAQYENFEIK